MLRSFNHFVLLAVLLVFTQLLLETKANGVGKVVIFKARTQPLSPSVRHSKNGIPKSIPIKHVLPKINLKKLNPPSTPRKFELVKAPLKKSVKVVKKTSKTVKKTVKKVVKKAPKKKCNCKEETIKRRSECRRRRPVCRRPRRLPRCHSRRAIRKRMVHKNKQHKNLKSLLAKAKQIQIEEKLALEVDQFHKTVIQKSKDWHAVCKQKKIANEEYRIRAKHAEIRSRIKKWASEILLLPYAKRLAEVAAMKKHLPKAFHQYLNLALGGHEQQEEEMIVAAEEKADEKYFQTHHLVDLNAPVNENVNLSVAKKKSGAVPNNGVQLGNIRININLNISD